MELTLKCFRFWLLFLCGLLVFAASAPLAEAQAPIDPNRPFRIASVASGLCWDVPGAVFQAGAQLQQFPCHMLENQQWKLFQHASSAGTVIQSVDNPNFCVSKSIANVLQLQVCSVRGAGVPAQLWRNPGFGNTRQIEIRSVQNNQCVDVPNASLGPINLNTFACHNGQNQKWVLLPLTP